MLQVLFPQNRLEAEQWGVMTPLPIFYWLLPEPYHSYWLDLQRVLSFFGDTHADAQSVDQLWERFVRHLLLHTIPQLYRCGRAINRPEICERLYENLKLLSQTVQLFESSKHDEHS